jgi:hypothetical protein
MSYEAAIASFGGDETTLTKSFVISLKSAVTNWYTRLPSRSITSWAQLKEKFLVNFQGFHVDVRTEEDFFSCQQYESKAEVATPTGAEAGAKIKKNFCIVCFMRDILAIR